MCHFANILSVCEARLDNCIFALHCIAPYTFVLGKKNRTVVLENAETILEIDLAAR